MRISRLVMVGASLAGLRQEDRSVFEASHAEVARWFAEGLVDGVRIDHPDGLADPSGYLTWLRELVGPDAWIVIEKILAVDEALERLGLPLRIATVVGGFSAALALARATDLVATVPERHTGVLCAGRRLLCCQELLLPRPGLLHENRSRNGLGTAQRNLLQDRL